MNTAAAAEAKVGAEPESGAAPNPDELKVAEDRAVECSVAFERADNDRGRLGLEFGQSILDLRGKKKAAGDRDWMSYLERLGISYEKARYWMAKVEGKPTNRHAKKAKVEPSEPSEKDMDDWERATSWSLLATELKVVSDHAALLKRDHQGSVGEEFLAQLKMLAEEMGLKTEPTEGEDA